MTEIVGTSPGRQQNQRDLIMQRYKSNYMDISAKYQCCCRNIQEAIACHTILKTLRSILFRSFEIYIALLSSYSTGLCLYYLFVTEEIDRGSNRAPNVCFILARKIIMMKYQPFLPVLLSDPMLTWYWQAEISFTGGASKLCCFFFHCIIEITLPNCRSLSCPGQI